MNRLTVPYSIRRMAEDTSATGHHEKLARIMENSEMEVLMSAAPWSEHYGQVLEIQKIVQAWLRRTLKRHRERGDL